MNDGTEFSEENPDSVADSENCNSTSSAITEIGSNVILRNRCLKLFFSLLYSGKKIHSKYCEDVVQVVGFDWILLFLQVKKTRLAFH